MSGASARIALALCACVAACGDGDAQMGADAGPIDLGPIGDDAAADADRDAADPLEHVPAPVEIPWLDEGTPLVAPAVLTPCAPGWIERVTEGEPAWCDPFPAGAPEACARPDEAHFPGAMGCATVGRACPAGDWADDLPESGVLYVRADEPAGGDGTRAAPFATIRAAMRAATRGTIIAVAKGHYPEPVELRAYVSVRGACTAETVLGPAGGIVVVVDGERTELHDVRISATDGAGLLASGGSSDVMLGGVVIERAVGLGIQALAGASVVGQDVVVRGARPSPDGAAFGRGVQIESGASLSLERAVIDDTREAGLLMYDEGTTATLRDVLVTGTQRYAPMEPAGAIVVDVGATLDAERVVVDRNQDTGFDVRGAGTTAVLRDVVVRATSTRMNGTSGTGVRAREGGVVTASRAAVVENVGSAMVALDEGSRVVLADVVVHGPPEGAVAAAFARGLDVQRGAVAEGDRMVFRGAQGISVVADDVGSEVTLRDLDVRETPPSAFDGHLGRAVEGHLGAALRLERARLSRSADVGVLAGSGASLALTDVVIEDVSGDLTERTFGRGMELHDGATATVARLLVRRVRDAGVLVIGEGSVLDAADLVVTDVESRMIDAATGYVLLAEDGGQVALLRARLERGHQAALVAMGTGASVVARDLVVGEARQAECTGAECTEFGGGHGIVAGGEATLVLESFAVADVDLCGLAVMTDASLDATRGSVRRAVVGACIQVDGYDVSRLSGDVAYIDNGVNLQTTSYPPPRSIEHAVEE